MKAYSMDLRERIFVDCDAGMRTRSVATKYRVSESWVRRLKQRRRECGERGPRQRQSRQQPKWLPHAETLKKLVQAQPDVTLKELRQRLGVDIGIQTLARALRAMQLTFKKRYCGPANRIVRMWQSVAPIGATECSAYQRSGSSSLMKPGPKPT
jgi:transposase